VTGDSIEHQVVNEHTPEWFKTAVFYEVLVRAFRDSNARTRTS
jgi:maltose alpha-D-glucosyltransferase / alpha-amylase